MDFEKDNFEDDNELSRLDDEELAGETEEIVETEEEELGIVGEVPEEEAGTIVPASSFCGIAPPRVGYHEPCLVPKLNAALLDSGRELPGEAWYLPEAIATISITMHVAGLGTDTPDARGRTVSPDALRRRLLLRREVPK